MTMQQDIKNAIEKILSSSFLEVFQSEKDAKAKVEQVFDEIEGRLNTIYIDLENAIDNEDFDDVREVLALIQKLDKDIRGEEYD